MDKDIKELIDRQFDLKHELRAIQGELGNMVMHYEGSLQDALKEGLVRLNFPAPPGFYSNLRNK